MKPTKMHTVDKITALICGAALVAICYAPEVKAQEADNLTLIVHTASKHGHVAGNYKFNEANPGLALNLRLSSDWSLQAGGYRNSYYKPTVYAGAEYTPVHIGNVSLGFFGGLATGYEHIAPVKIGSLAVMAGLYTQIDLGRATIGIRAVPKLGPKSAAVAAIEFGYKF